MLDTWVEKWLEDPDGGGIFPPQRDSILAHDQECTSLNHAWLPRRKGVSCPSDLMECDTCGITFFWEGIVGFFDDCPDSEYFFCQCCSEKIAVCPCGNTCAKQP